MELIKKQILHSGLFSSNELNTMQQLKNIHLCKFCSSKKHDYAILDCCKNKICSDCADILYDNYSIIKKSDILFFCPFCNDKILDIQFNV